MQKVSTHGPPMPLRLWQRMEEAQVSNVSHERRIWSLRIKTTSQLHYRILHTAYLFDVGLLTSRFDRTQEDLSSTSQRLQRYEQLLDQITPMVSPDVQVIIDQARREQVSNQPRNPAQHQFVDAPGSRILEGPSRQKVKEDLSHLTCRP